MMLDTKSTFDDARDALRRRSRARPSGSWPTASTATSPGRLSGTQEYMATEKLYELHEGDQFDLVVVDTPPTRNALDFLDAPRRLTRFLDHRLYRVLMTPTRAYLKAVGLAAQAFLRTVSKVVGGEVLDDAIAFFQAFDGMEEGFRERAERVARLLAAPETAYVLVTSPRRRLGRGGGVLRRRAGRGAPPVAALIVNRMHPSFGAGSADEARAAATTVRRHRPRRRSGRTWPTSADSPPARRRSSSALAGAGGAGAGGAGARAALRRPRPRRPGAGGGAPLRVRTVPLVPLRFTLV